MCKIVSLVFYSFTNAEPGKIATLINSGVFLETTGKLTKTSLFTKVATLPGFCNRKWVKYKTKNLLR